MFSDIIHRLVFILKTGRILDKDKTMDNALKGKRFQDDEDSKKNVTAELNAVSFEAFTHSFQELFKRLTHVFGRRLLGIEIKQFLILLYLLFLFIIPVRELYCQTTHVLLLQGRKSWDMLHY
jgi:hypothetical protein